VTIERARAVGLLECGDQDKTKLAACDSTGMEAGHVSTYFGKRCKRKYRRFPKFWAVVTVASHVCLSMVPGTGPTPDDPQFHRVARQARDRHPFRALAADCGFDGEKHQQFLSEKLNVIGIIPPERGRPRTRSDPNRRGGFYRQFIHDHWPKRIYGQRWQVETFFSMLKRLLDSYLRATNWRSQHREMCLKCLTLNFMVIAAAA